MFRNDKSVSTAFFMSYDILKIIQNSNPDKIYGHDRICTRMLKVCGNSICKPL